jgi:hypothetical protein
MMSGPPMRPSQVIFLGTRPELYTGGHIPERELFALSPDNREDHDGGADVRDDEQQLREHPERDLVVLPAAGDVSDRVVEHGLVEQERGIDVTKVMR